nr:zinc finger, CCHC-type [Tanacetum cinerariifolium]
MASMNTRLNIEKLDRNIVEKHGGSKQVGLKQLGPGVETGVYGVHDEKRVRFEVELQGAQGDREAEGFHVSNDDTAVAQRRLDDKQPKEKTNTDCLSGVAKHLGVAGIHQENGFIDETNVILFAKYGLSKVFWAEDTTRCCLDHTFEVEPQENVNQGAGLQEVQTQDLMDYQLARDREHLACKLFGYREDSNKDAFAVVAVDKIYAHESLTFNDTAACEVISKWKAGLKEDMDVRSDVYVLTMVARKAVTTAMVITKSLHHTLLKRHSTLSLEDSLSRDCDVKKNGKWSCIYAVGSKEYQMVFCTRLDIASADVGLQHIEALSTTEAGYMTFTEAWKKKIWLKGLLTES